MGNYIVTKGILLDERDFEGWPHETLDSLADTVCSYLEEEFGNPDPWSEDTLPSLEIDAILSERFDAAWVDSLKWSRWIQPEGGFREALLPEFKRLPLPDPEKLLDLAEADPAALEPGLRTMVCDAVMAGDYGPAQTLISVLGDIRSSGIPGVAHRNEFDTHEDDVLYDFREKWRPAGSRILAQIGFNWGQ